MMMTMTMMMMNRGIGSSYCTKTGTLDWCEKHKVKASGKSTIIYTNAHCTHTQTRARARIPNPFLVAQVEMLIIWCAHIRCLFYYVIDEEAWTWVYYVCESEMLNRASANIIMRFRLRMHLFTHIQKMSIGKPLHGAKITGWPTCVNIKTHFWCITSKSYSISFTAQMPLPTTQFQMDHCEWVHIHVRFGECVGQCNTNGLCTIFATPGTLYQLGNVLANVDFDHK